MYSDLQKCWSNRKSCRFQINYGVHIYSFAVRAGKGVTIPAIVNHGDKYSKEAYIKLGLDQTYAFIYYPAHTNHPLNATIERYPIHPATTYVSTIDSNMWL